MPNGEVPLAERLPSFLLGLGTALVSFFMITGGAGVGQQISLFAGVISSVVAMVPTVLGARGVPEQRARHLRGFDIALVAAPALGLALVGNWLFQSGQDWAADFGRTVRLVEGKETMVDVTAPAGRGRELSGTIVFRPQLTPDTTQASATDCVVPAVLTIVPLIDERNAGTWTVPYTDNVSIPIAGSAKKVQLRVTVAVPGKDVCVVNLDFRDGRVDRRVLDLGG